MTNDQYITARIIKNDIDALKSVVIEETASTAVKEWLHSEIDDKVKHLEELFRNL